MPSAVAAWAVALLYSFAPTAWRHRGAPKPPVWPSDYTVSYTFSVPYVRTYQKQGLEYPTVVWVEEGGKRLRVDIYASENVIITTKEREVEIVPKYDKTECLIFLNHPSQHDDGPRLNLGSNVDGAIAVLPDVSDWPFKGSAVIDGESVNLWEYEKRHQAKTIKYSFWIREDGSPVRLRQHGNDLFTGSHIDEWLVDFTSYVPGPSKQPVFQPPALCDGVKPGNRTVGSQGFRNRMHGLIPRLPLGDNQVHTIIGELHSQLGRKVVQKRREAYNSFAAQHGRVHKSHSEHVLRQRVYEANVKLIEDWNAGISASPGAPRRHTLAINKFADWTEEEFMAVMLPNHNRKMPRPDRKERLMHKPVTPRDRVPKSVDWKNSGADGPVKDQCACGSCWAFAAAGAIQSAYFMATGREQLFSEQQLMDCSWGHTENKACDGGLYEGAFEYLTGKGKKSKEKHSKGGSGHGHRLAFLDDYPYRGANSFCRDDTLPVESRGVIVKGFTSVEKGDVAGIKEALYTKGPLAVSIDAAQPTFRFYSSGVYNDPSCKWKQDDLDHSVMLVGYGTSDDGQDYWTIKNEWSSHWGDKGYMRMSRDNHGCGVVSDAAYAIVDVDDAAHKTKSHGAHRSLQQAAEQ